jgi:hypothetical protein
MPLPLFITSRNSGRAHSNKQTPRIRRFRLVVPTSANARMVLPIMCTDDPFDDRCGVDDGLGGDRGGGGGIGLDEPTCNTAYEQCLGFCPFTGPFVFECLTGCLAGYYACLALPE